MDSFVELFQGISIVLLISIILGLLAIIRIYFMATPDLQRVSKYDRRRSTIRLSFPMHDTKNNLINEDRRKLMNRRLASNVIIDSYRTSIS